MFEEMTAHLYKQMKIAQKWPGELAHVFVYPTISIVSLGILAYFMVSQGAPLEAMTFIFVGVLMWNFYEMGERTMSYGITLDIWNESLKHTFAGMTRLRHFVAGNMLYGSVGAIIGFLILGFAGIFAFGFNIFEGGMFLFGNLISIYLFATGVGMMINGLMATKGSKYMAIIWIIPGLVMVFSGVYYPAELLPGGAYQVSLGLPSTHAISSLRSAFGGLDTLAFTEFLLGLGMSVAYFIAGGLLFNLGIKRGRNNGVLTKY